MEVCSCRIDSNFFCIWSGNGLFMLEDVEQKVQVPLHPSQFLWFENHMVEINHLPIPTYFYYQIRDALGQRRLQKFKNNQLWFLKLVLWLATGGRKIIIISARLMRKVGHAEDVHCKDYRSLGLETGK